MSKTASVEVRIELDTRASRLLLRDPVAGEPAILALRDDAGEVPHTLELGDAWVLSLDRLPRGRLHLTYRLVPPPVGDDDRVEPRFYMDPASGMMHAMGESIFWLPEDDVPRRCKLEIKASQADVATSLGLGSRFEDELSSDALRGIHILVGALGTARFRTPQGDDDAASFGVSAFDLRWVAAETAGVRTSVGEYFGMFDPDRFTTLVIIGFRPPNAAPYAAQLRTRSLVVDGAAWAPWDGAARLLVAHALVHRFVGGRLRVEMGGAPGEGVWFAHGFSRHVARVVLFRLGLLTDDEMVAELDSLDSVLATSALAGLGNVEVVQHGTPEAVRLVTARGALYAARLESVIATHTRGNRTLEGALASLVRRAIHTGPELSLVQWEELIADCAGAEEVQAFRSMVLEGRPVDVPSDAMGPCFRSTRGRHVPFELGFVDTGFTGEPIAAHDVDPLGPAHAAGLRSGDTIVELRYRLGDPSVEVVAVIERDGDRLELGWAPRGAAVPGRRWIRDRRVPDVACVQ